MEIIIGVAAVVFVIGLISLAEYFSHLNSRALEAAYTSLSSAIHERDEAIAKLSRAQAEIEQLNLTIATLTKEGRDAAEM